MVGTAATRSYKETKYSVITRDIGQSSIALIAALFGAYLVDSFTYVIVGYVFSLVIGTLLSVFFLINLGAIRRKPAPTFNISEIFAFAFPLAIVAVANYILTWTDVLMLKFFVSSTELGWYQAAYQTSLMLTILLQSANSVFPSVAADLHHRGGTEKLEDIFMTLTKWVTSLSSLGFVFVVLYSNILMGIFDVSSEEAKFALIVLCAGQLVTVSTGPVGKLLAMSGYDRIESLNTIIILILNVGLNFVFIQKYGTLGAGLATAISLSSLNILRVAESWFFLNILPFSIFKLKTIAPLGVAIGSLLAFNILLDFTFISMILVGFMTLTIFFITKLVIGFDEEDKILIDSLK
jgi:O-antigen/teichoic acid export membrane protein